MSTTTLADTAAAQGAVRQVSVEADTVINAALHTGNSALTRPSAAIRSTSLSVQDFSLHGRCAGPDAAALAAVLPVATDHGSHASGVVFAPGRVLTAAHAVQGASHFFVRTGRDFRRADLISVDHDADLAVLAIDTGNIRPLPLSNTDLSSRERVWAVGFPRAKGLEMSAGVFQRLDGGAVHSSASIDSGQSGGGLLSCDRGEYAIAGMLRGYGAYRSGDRYVKLNNHSVSVAAGTIHRFLSATAR